MDILFFLSDDCTEIQKKSTTKLGIYEKISTMPLFYSLKQIFNDY